MFTYMRKNMFICLNSQKCKYESIWIITFTIIKAFTCHRFMLTECYSTNVSKGLPTKGTRGASCINHEWFSHQIASACLRSAAQKSSVEEQAALLTRSSFLCVCSDLAWFGYPYYRCEDKQLHVFIKDQILAIRFIYIWKVPLSIQMENKVGSLLFG